MNNIPFLYNFFTFFNKIEVKKVYRESDSDLSKSIMNNYSDYIDDYVDMLNLNYLS
jgi:hypothetical protein